MIERHIYIRLRDEKKAEVKRVVAQETALLGRTDAVAAVRLLEPADAPAEGAWDLSAVITFPSLAVAERFIGSALYRSFEEDVLEVHALVVKVWNLAPLVPAEQE